MSMSYLPENENISDFIQSYANSDSILHVTSGNYGNDMGCLMCLRRGRRSALTDRYAGVWNLWSFLVQGLWFAAHGDLLVVHAVSPSNPAVKALATGTGDQDPRRCASE